MSKCPVFGQFGLEFSHVHIGHINVWRGCQALEWFTRFQTSQQEYVGFAVRHAQIRARIETRLAKDVLLFFFAMREPWFFLKIGRNIVEYLGGLGFGGDEEHHKTAFPKRRRGAGLCAINKSRPRYLYGSDLLRGV